MTDSTILVDDFIKTWEEVMFEGLELRPVTQRLVRNLCWDLPLTPAGLNDFGVETADHYRALKEVLTIDGESWNTEKQGKGPAAGDGAIQELKRRIMELERAYGNGPQLTALVKKYGSRYRETAFSTPWDIINAGMGEEETAS
jgi:hypothetical protein